MGKHKAQRRKLGETPCFEETLYCRHLQEILIKVLIAFPLDSLLSNLKVQYAIVDRPYSVKNHWDKYHTNQVTKPGVFF
jgi:hypothetical protein